MVSVSIIIFGKGIVKLTNSFKITIQLSIKSILSVLSFIVFEGNLLSISYQMCSFTALYSGVDSFHKMTAHHMG